jgi:hypothetical protein
MDYLLNHRTVICGSPDTCIKQLEHIREVTGLGQCPFRCGI